MSPARPRPASNALVMSLTLASIFAAVAHVALAIAVFLWHFSLERRLLQWRSRVFVLALWMLNSTHQAYISAGELEHDIPAGGQAHEASPPDAGASTSVGRLDTAQCGEDARQHTGDGSLAREQHAGSLLDEAWAFCAHLPEYAAAVAFDISATTAVGWLGGAAMGGPLFHRWPEALTTAAVLAACLQSCCTSLRYGPKGGTALRYRPLLPLRLPPLAWDAAEGRHHDAESRRLAWSVRALWAVILAAWASAFVVPLDWGAAYQAWPVPTTYAPVAAHCAVQASVAVASAVEWVSAWRAQLRRGW